MVRRNDAQCPAKAHQTGLDLTVSPVPAPVSVAVAIPMSVTMVVVVIVLVLLALGAGFVLCRLHKVDRPAACIVFMAVLAPVFCMAGRHMHVDRRDRTRLLHDDDRLRIHHRRPSVADIDLAIHARRNFTANAHADIQVTGMGGTLNE